jgi:pilus assembly protein CpaE
VRELIGISREEFEKETKDKKFNVCVVGKDEKIIERLKKDFEGISSVNLSIFEGIEYFVAYLESDNNKYKNTVFVLVVNSLAQIEAAKVFLRITNIVSMVIGPDSYAFALEAGQRGVEVYIPFELYKPEKLFEFIAKSEYVIKKQKNFSRISVFTGISGGLGTTTIAMNIAHILSQNHPFKNILFMDLSSTKGISNIFFGMPKANKSIVDLFGISVFDEKNMLENGAYKYSQNLYFIPGIQRHTDRELVFHDDKEPFFVEFLYFTKKVFDVVIIDLGLAEDVNLKTAIQEVADEIYVVSELKTPNISILKTYVELMTKAGWKDKVKIVVNRSDSANVITPSDAKQIISDGGSGAPLFDNILPNDSESMRGAWNEGMLLYPQYKNSSFYKALLAMASQNFELEGRSGEVKKEPQASEGSLIDKLKGMFKWA